MERGYVAAFYLLPLNNFLEKENCFWNRLFHNRSFDNCHKITLQIKAMTRLLQSSIIYFILGKVNNVYLLFWKYVGGYLII